MHLVRSSESSVRRSALTLCH